MTATPIPDNDMSSSQQISVSRNAFPSNEPYAFGQTVDAEIKARISRIALLNEKFISNRFLPGTDGLLDKLAAEAGGFRTDLRFR